MARPGSFEMPLDLEDPNELGSLGMSDSMSEGAEANSLSSRSSTGSNANRNNTNNEYDMGISKYDQSILAFSRACFIFVLLLSAISLAFVIYYTLHNEEVEDFETQFQSLATEVIELSNDHVRTVFGILAGLSATATSWVKEEHERTGYPLGFMTLPDAESHFTAARNASGALVAAYLPLVQPDDLLLWSIYSQEKQQWIAESNSMSESDPIYPQIWDYVDTETRRQLSMCGSGDDRRSLEAKEKVALPPTDGPFAPVWTFSPPPPADDTTIVNYNLFDKPVFKKAVDFMAFTRKPTFLDVCNQAAWFGNKDHKDVLQTVIAGPVFADFTPEAPIVGHILEIVPWATFFTNILTDGTKPVRVVLENTCNEVFTFEVSGREAYLIAEEDMHDSQYDSLAVSSVFAGFANPPELQHAGLGEVCIYTMHVYPTESLENDYYSSRPLIFAFVVVGVFLLTSVLFFAFNWAVKRQQEKVMTTAKRQNAIVRSLFPKNIHAKLMGEHAKSESEKLSKVGKAGLRNYLMGGGKSDEKKDNENTGTNTTALLKSKPIADLFPETTIMFADIAGFTAWSSSRQPAQVFQLLETIYHEFDAIANRRRVFKVEVVGDCYVAVCGLPDPRKDHAMVMAKFAVDCLRAMKSLTSTLVVELGPDTQELRLRVGLHSGPVVAGVLRGEKSRFQLFGDTMNTASRMESTGITNKIQLSQDTASKLIGAGKARWLEPREEKVKAKGKGELSTFILKDAFIMGAAKASTCAFSETSSDATSEAGSDLQDLGRQPHHTNRHGRWTIEVLSGLLKDIEIRRRATGTKRDNSNALSALESLVNEIDGTVIDEVQEIVELPKIDAKAAQNEAKINADEVELDDAVHSELQDYVMKIGSLYNDNPFHNFPHATHVTMSVVKLLSRIVAPDVEDLEDPKGSSSFLHDHTYGITSDPLTRFAVVFSALVHDVDHQGVSNQVLVDEGSPVAELYKNKSVAEANSIDLAWDLLMEDRYSNLRRQIYTTSDEFQRFRQLVVNTVMATDIMDKDLKELRNKRWADAFAVDEQSATSRLSTESSRKAVNRKATIVIEHLIQASDVSHTMQHWQIYRKWNEKLFREMYKAWQEGRLENDPSLNWYKGEIGFFDFYIIPLAKKLKDCGVFGVSSDEYLSYALQNRNEWENRGEALVKEMVQNVQREHKQLQATEQQTKAGTNTGGNRRNRQSRRLSQ